MHPSLESRESRELLTSRTVNSVVRVFSAVPDIPTIWTHSRIRVMTAATADFQATSIDAGSSCCHAVICRVTYRRRRYLLPMFVLRHAGTSAISWACLVLLLIRMPICLTIRRSTRLPAIFPPIRRTACEIFLRDMVARVAIRFTMWKPSAEQVDGLKPTRKMDMRFAATGRVWAAKRRCNSSSSPGRLIGERRRPCDNQGLLQDRDISISRSSKRRENTRDANPARSKLSMPCWENRDRSFLHCCSPHAAQCEIDRVFAHAATSGRQ
jgi:hypothetical protein